MFAECNNRLFKTVNMLFIKEIALNEGIKYLGSITIPMYATRDGMIDFFKKNSLQPLKVRDNSCNYKEQNFSFSFSEKIPHNKHLKKIIYVYL